MAGRSGKTCDQILVMGHAPRIQVSCHFCFSVSKYSNSFSGITTQTRSTSETQRSESYALDLPLCRCLLRTIRPPSPTISVELQWGELHWGGAFGTCTHVAGSFSISEWLVLLPSGQLLVHAIRGRSISKWQHFGY